MFDHTQESEQMKQSLHSGGQLYNTLKSFQFYRFIYIYIYIYSYYSVQLNQSRE